MNHREKRLCTGKERERDWHTYYSYTCNVQQHKMCLMNQPPAQVAAKQVELTHSGFLKIKKCNIFNAYYTLYMYMCLCGMPLCGILLGVVT